MAHPLAGDSTDLTEPLSRVPASGIDPSHDRVSPGDTRTRGRHHLVRCGIIGVPHATPIHRFNNEDPERLDSY